MPVDNTTYNFCIESLRYIYNIIGYDSIIQELKFIQHLNTPSKTECIPEYIARAMLGTDDMTEYEYFDNDVSEVEQDATSNKNIVIETKSNKYARTELSDEVRCDTILPTGKRCTFKKLDKSNKCSRHTK